MRALLFWGVLLLLLPVYFMGYIPLVLIGTPRVRKRGIAATAVPPLSARWILDYTGQRPDAAARKLLPHLPFVPKFTLQLCLLPLTCALRISGHIPSIARYPVHTPQNFWEALGQRNTFFDEAISNAEATVTQFVHLGAGFDTRSHRVSSSIKVFEVDRPAIQQTKREGLDRAGVPQERIHYVEVDFGDPGWWSTLENAGYDPSAPTFFLWEGVSYYLQEADVERMLTGTAQRSPPGSQIAFDYARLDLIHGAGGPLMAFVRLGLKSTRESWTWGLDTTAPAIEPARELVERCGLRLRHYSVYGLEGGRHPPPGGLVVAEVA